MLCSQCGKEIPEGASFCCWCGTKYAGKVCAMCGAKLRSGQLFCHECGLKCDSDKTQVTERPQVEGPELPENPKVQKLYIVRKWQAGTSEMIFKIYINTILRGSISGGESISVDIVTDETLGIEINGYDRSTSQVMFREGFLLTDMDNPQIFLELSAGFKYWEQHGFYPNIEVTVKGANILMKTSNWSKKPDESRVQKRETSFTSIEEKLISRAIYNNALGPFDNF